MKTSAPDAGIPLQVPSPRESTRDAASEVSLFDDLMVLTKARLSTLVLVTTFVGFCLASTAGTDWILLVHTLLGTAFVAAGASVFNQVLERGPDSRMQRTKDRPLPAGRLGNGIASAIGAVLSVAGLLQLALFVNAAAAIAAALTLGIYVLVYTPLKRHSSTCTLVGAVSGALPPVIGWVAAGGGLDSGAAFLFALLFLWQLPHFLAINWIYRDDYSLAGFRMWSNGDESGRLTSWLAAGFTVLLVGLTGFLLPLPFSNAFTIAGGLICGAMMLFCALDFLRDRSVSRARRLFFSSIIYLPLVLGVLLFGA